MRTYMATDQFGNTYHDLGAHPRKELMQRIGKKSARKMYVDSKTGTAKHIGWVIGKHWLTVLEVKALNTGD